MHMVRRQFGRSFSWLFQIIDAYNAEDWELLKYERLTHHQKCERNLLDDLFNHDHRGTDIWTTDNCLLTLNFSI